MAGTIGLSASRRWSVSSWLFDWALRETADLLGPGATTGVLNEIVDNNLGWFGLDDVPPAERPRVTAALAFLPERAAQRLPADLPDRDQVLATLQELAAMARLG